MPTAIADTSRRTAVRVAGVMFLFSLIVPLLNWALVLSRLIVEDDAIATVDNIVANESLFRLGIAVELVMSVGLVVLAVALYSILATTSRHLALLALVWKVAEATLSAAIVLASLFALQMLDETASMGGVATGQLQASVGFILSEHKVLYSTRTSHSRRSTSSEVGRRASIGTSRSMPAAMVAMSSRPAEPAPPTS